MHNFKNWTCLSEATGIDRDRVREGKISFEDKSGTTWTATEWLFEPRHDANAPKIATTKSIGSKSSLQRVERPEYLKLIKRAENFVGTTDDSKAKGVVLIVLKGSNGKASNLAMKTTTDTSPKALQNKVLDSIGWQRSDPTGAKLSRLTASVLIAGATTGDVMVNGETVKHFMFKNLSNLKSTILQNMAASNFSNLKDPRMVKETGRFLDELASSGSATFNWAKTGNLMNEVDRRKFGIYLVSELGYPFVVWSGKAIDGFPGFSKTNYFGVPTDSTNASYDSCLGGVLLTGGKGTLLVSSKTKLKGGAGARGSIMPKTFAMAKKYKDDSFKGISNRFLALLLKHFRAQSSPLGIGANTIFPFMINDVLKLGSVIGNPVDLKRKICVLTGYNKGTLSKDEMADLEKAILAIQKKFSSGFSLPGVGVKAVIDQNAAAYLNPKQWKKFAQYVPHAFCVIVSQGINVDTSDYKGSEGWQLSLDNEKFVTDGSVRFFARKLEGSAQRIAVDPGKNPVHDPRRETSWIGFVPIKG